MRRFLILLIVAVTAFSIGGCGGGSSADPLGTDSITFAGAASQVDPNGTVVLTATVKNASGAAVIGRDVTFGFVANASGATLSRAEAPTGSAGEATVLYRAGAGSGVDVVRASISNGGSSDVGITVGSGGGGGGSQIALSGSPTSLAAGKNSILTATVTDVSGNLLSGQAVTFAFVTPTTIGSTIITINGVTDGSGRAVAVYTAGSTGTTSVEETIQATVGVIGVNGSVDLVNITRTASTAVPPAGYLLTIAADVTSLAAGQSAIVTATVTDGVGNAFGGQAVTFALFSDASVATLNTLNGTLTNTTDASGKVVAIYTAGANSPTLSVQDTVQASITGATGAIIMTRTAAATPGPTGLRMTVTATPTSLVAGAMSVIVATVSNADGTKASGETVTFAFVTNNSGAPALTLVNNITDTNGTAIATYTAGNNSPGLSIQDAVSASASGTAGAVIITRLAATGTGNRISLTLTPATTSALPLGTTTSNCIVKATVLRDDGVTPVAGETVTFSIVTGGGAIAPLTVTTNNSGIANAIFTAPGTVTGNQAVVRAQILGTTNGGDAVGIIYW